MKISLAKLKTRKRRRQSGKIVEITFKDGYELTEVYNEKIKKIKIK